MAVRDVEFSPSTPHSLCSAGTLSPVLSYTRYAATPLVLSRVCCYAPGIELGKCCTPLVLTRVCCFARTELGVRN
eukprot:1227699-Rhodomonas_salina.1